MFTNDNEFNAWKEGLFAGANNLRQSNPYPNETKLHSFWNDGFKVGKLAN